jgi:bifunctional diaminopimelate decarboxylase / aspartate kinase
MTQRIVAPWIVLKFGGTSVSTLANWRNIASVARKRRAEGAQVLIVHSAVSGITDRLERLVSAALLGEHEAALESIKARHLQLCTELGLGSSPQLDIYFAVLRQIALDIKQTQTISDRTRARLMSHGELMATEIGSRYLKSQSLDVSWWDARTGLKAQERIGGAQKGNWLSATCDFTPDASLATKLAALAPIVITQGFIASDFVGDTVLLGRGGSDTSGAYFAAKLLARRLEIWTDVPGMFSANPRSTPSARLLRELHYDEAQEIASSGAKVLHPRCVLPVRMHGIPLFVYATQWPDLEGTHITATNDSSAKVKAVCVKKGITLVSLESPGMWHEVGFLADAFQVFKAHGLSVDLVSTSETNVTVSLDPQANTLDEATLDALTAALSELCKTQIIGPCASVSLVGRNIRGILHKLGEAFEFFAEQKIYLVSQAANDLNFTFVVDESQADRLVEQLHASLVHPERGDRVLGPTWEELFRKPAPALSAETWWWQDKSAALLSAFGNRDAAYVYDAATVQSAVRQLRSLRSINRVHYAMKANWNAALLKLLHAQGIEMECVSLAELEHVFKVLPQVDRSKIRFTPNFAPRSEYAAALAHGVNVTLDNLHALRSWPELFRGRQVLVRIDTGIGRGHHQHVKTAGTYSKFGVPLSEVAELAKLSAELNLTVFGLHAHTGSGIFDINNWIQVANTLAQVAANFSTVTTLNLGGGFGVPDSNERTTVDFAALDQALLAFKSAHPGFDLWIEPGRFPVAVAGVLLARVTQLKHKGDQGYIGVATGTNALIRPQLYGAFHEIVNLSRLGEPGVGTYDVVGPICESGDVLGHDRLLPDTREGDVLLIANAGAYGRSMASSYNLREPPEELILSSGPEL